MILVQINGNKRVTRLGLNLRARELFIMALDDNSTDVAPMDGNECLGDSESFHDAFQERSRGCHTQKKLNLSKSIVRILASRINKCLTLPGKQECEKAIHCEQSSIGCGQHNAPHRMRLCVV